MVHGDATRITRFGIKGLFQMCDGVVLLHEVKYLISFFPKQNINGVNPNFG
jgi:hypothetical protein